MCYCENKKGNPMSIEENKKLMKKFETMINTADEKLAEELVDKDAIFYAPTHSEPLIGPKGYLAIVNMMRSSFSDVQWKIDEMIAEDDKIAVRYTCTGTHDGNFFGFDATGKKFKVRCMNFYYIKDGKFTGDIGNPDIMGIMMQIGALPS